MRLKRDVDVEEIRAQFVSMPVLSIQNTITVC